MRINRIGLWLLALTGLVLAFGFSRLRLEASLFDLLPRNSAIVEGLRQVQENFGSSHELIISLRAADAAAAAHAAQTLAEALENSDVTSRVIWRDPLRDDPAALGELAAYLWFNQSPERFAAMANRFQQTRLTPTLEHTLEQLQTSLGPQELARLGRDPYALTDLLEQLPLPLARATADPFASPDGAFRVLFVTAPFEKGTFWRERKWVESVRNLAMEWKRGNELAAAVTLRFTGRPLFITEVGSSLLRDMVLAVLGTLAIVAGLFWAVHRSWVPLVWLVVLLVGVLAVTTALGAVLFGALHAASLGFAAILLGLAADYGLILYQEHLAHPGRSVVQHRATVAPSILWAAATTASAFFMLTRSSLPGLTQLGTLVAIGITVAAVVMLTGFLAPLVAKTTPRAPALRTSKGERSRSSGSLPAPSTRVAWVITCLAAAIIALVLLKQFPTVDYGTTALRPSSVQARAVLEEIQREIGGFDDDLWLIVSGSNENEVAGHLKQVKTLLDPAVEAGQLAGYTLPEALWPQPEAQAANRELARWLATRWAAARTAALDAGFTRPSLRLTEQAFKAWQRFTETRAVAKPEQSGAQWLFRRFAAEDSGRLLALGQVHALPGARNSDLVRLAEQINASDSGRLVGWPLLSESLLEAMRRDTKQVLLPMSIVLVLLLAVAFRRFAEIALSLVTLGFSLLCLLGAMAILGWSWNLMNVMALALLLGAGVDYSIHIQLALRRYHGDVLRVRETVGRAILLCGASTAAAFGTLGFASSAGLASLGKLSAVGIGIVSLVSVFVLPVWWQTIRLRLQGQPDADWR